MAKKEKRRSGDRTYHYTYLITDHMNNKYYYGVHSTDFNPEDIEQYHSSSKQLKLLIKEFGIVNFSKSVRRYFQSRATADAWEHKVLRRLKVRTNTKFYNQTEGGIGYTTSGYLTVKDKVTGTHLRVAVDDPYIGILYDCNSKGRPLTSEAKDHLSSLYKGVKWVGKDNPVHYLKDDPDWVRKISDANKGRSLNEDQILALKRPEQWQHLTDKIIKVDVRERMNFMRSINNIKFNTIYMFDGVVYTCRATLPVDIKNKYVVSVSERHPFVDTIRAGKYTYPTIQSAAEALNVHTNTISNRIKSSNSYWDDHYFIDEGIVTENKIESLSKFREEMTIKYKTILDDQKVQVKPFSVGMSDVEATENFMRSGSFLPNTIFSRIPEKSSYANNAFAYDRYSVICPICSNDEYVAIGVCTGIFKASYSALLRGESPCRCGMLRSHRMEDMYLYHIKEVLHSEQCKFLSLNGDFKGKKESKFIWECRSGNTHENTRIGLFLEAGSRCVCCRKNYYKDNPPTIINLKDKFSKRKEDYLIQQEKLKCLK